METPDTEYLSKCLYERNHPELSLCPVFKLGDIVSNAGEDYVEMSVRVSVYGYILYLPLSPAGGIGVSSSVRTSAFLFPEQISQKLQY